MEAGVVNLEVTRRVSESGYYYAPDPSSQTACTIGGNVAGNSGGPHTLKYGVTLNHLLGLEIVLPDGNVVVLDRSSKQTAYDLAGVCVGSEGTLGIVTAATLRLLVRPEAVATLLAVFPSVLAATRAVSSIIAAGIIPAALEMMDQLIIEAVEAAYGFGFPADAGALLVIELDGIAAGVELACARVSRCCSEQGASEVRRAADEQERDLLWKSRKRAFGAMGRLAPSYCTQDGVVPRTKLPEILCRIVETEHRYALRIGNVFHAGDGNIHPIILYDERDADQVRRFLDAGREILEACVALGGSVTGQHGVGVEKIAQMPLLFSPDDLLVMSDPRAFHSSERLYGDSTHIDAMML